MNLAGIVWGDGLVLTDDVMSDRTDVITEHQVTYADFAEQFVWNADIDLDGAGIQAAAHFNGTIADARFFGAGDDADAIQRAVDWVAATSEGKGIVLVPALAGQWSIDKTVAVPAGVWIIAGEGAEFSLDFSGYAFTLAAGADDVRIQGVILDGNQSSAGGIVTVAGNSAHLTIVDCHMGLSGSTSTSYCGGHLFDGGANTNNHCRLIRCNVYGAGAICRSTGSSDDMQVLNCRLEAVGNTTTANIGIQVSNTNHVVIRDCYLYCHHATTPHDRGVYLNNCDYTEFSHTTVMGGRLSSVRLQECDYADFHNNRVLNGATAAVVGDDACVWVDGSDLGHYHDNVITGVGALAATIPINTRYSLMESDGIIVGSVASSKNSYWDNLFAWHNFATGGVGTGDYRVVAVFPCLYIANSQHWNNRYFEHQYGAAALTGGSPTEGITVAGLTPGPTAASWTSVTATQISANAEAIYIASVGADAITVGQHGGANLTAGDTVSWQIDG